MLLWLANIRSGCVFMAHYGFKLECFFFSFFQFLSSNRRLCRIICLLTIINNFVQRTLRSPEKKSNSHTKHIEQGTCSIYKVFFSRPYMSSTACSSCVQRIKKWFHSVYFSSFLFISQIFFLVYFLIFRYSISFFDFVIIFHEIQLIINIFRFSSESHTFVWRVK